MKAVFLGLVLLAVIVSAFLSFKTTPSGPSIAGVWDVQALGSKQGEVEAGYGNSVVELHLSRNLFTMLHRYSGTGTIHPGNGPIQEFKVIDVSVFPSGQFDGFMVGTGEAKQDGGSFGGTFNGTTLTMKSVSTHTMEAQMQGVLEKGTHADALALYKQLK